MIFAPALVGALTSCRPVAQKEIVVSIPADGRWDRYPTPEAVCGLLDTIAWAGFNSIKVDVKPVVGYCEFESSYLEPMRTMKTRPGAHEDWDYAATFIREGRRRGLKVSLTCAVFPMGAWQLGDGPAFRDPSKDGWFCVEYLPDGLRDIREDRRQGVFCFMNPSHPEVHDFVLGYIEELLAKYKPDGFQLDYTPIRLSDITSGTASQFLIPPGTYRLAMGAVQNAGFDMVCSIMVDGQTVATSPVRTWGTSTTYHYDRGTTLPNRHPEGYDSGYVREQSGNSKADNYHTDGGMMIEEVEIPDLNGDGSAVPIVIRLRCANWAGKTNVKLCHWCLRPTANNY